MNENDPNPLRAVACILAAYVVGVAAAMCVGGCASHVEPGCYVPPQAPPAECGEGHYRERPECVRYYIDRRVAKAADWLGCGCTPRLTPEPMPGDGFCDEPRFGDVLDEIDRAETCGDLLTLDAEPCRER